MPARKIKASKTSDLTELRHQAEQKLLARKKKAASPFMNEADNQRLFHELEVRQIELEMQNEELIQLRAEMEMALDQYTDLYDFAPMGYFTITRDGQIRKTNLAGSKLLGVERSELIELQFGMFVSIESQPIFNIFLEKVFSTNGNNVTCELVLQQKRSAPLWVHIEAASDGKQNETCRIVVVDITEVKRADEEIRNSMRLLQTIGENFPYSYLSVINKDLTVGFTTGQGFKNRNLDPNSYIGHHINNVFGDYGSEVLEKVSNAYLKTFNGHQQSFELFVNGEYQSYDTVPLADHKGNINQILAVVQNITKRKRAEAQIEYQANLLKHINDAVLAVDGQFRITAWNQAAEKMYGWSAAEALGNLSTDIIRSEMTKEKRQEIISSLHEFGEYRIELIQYRKDGQPVYVDASTITLYDEDKQPKGLLSVNRDITERKRAEEALRESEQLFSKIFMDSPIAISMVELPGGKNIEVNHAWCELTGFSREEAIGHDTAELGIFNAEERNKLIKEFTDQKYSKLVESEITTKSGEKKNILISSELITIKEQQHILASVIDITERKQAEDEIRRLKDFDETLINNMGEGIMVQNMEGYFTFVNPSASEITGYPAEELLGAHWTRFFLADQHDIIKEADNQRLAGESSKYELDFLHKSGRRINMLVSGSPLFENERFNGSMAVFIDITERKRAEGQIQRQIQHLRALHTIDSAISSSFDLRMILGVLLNEVISQLGVDAADVLLFNQAAQVLEYAAARGFHSDALKHSQLRLGEGFASRAIVERRIIHIPNIMEAGGNLGKSLLLAGESFVTYFGVPLIAKGRVEGVLEIFHRNPLEHDQAWMDFLEALAKQAAIAINNAQLLQNLQHSNTELIVAYDATLEGWSRAMDLRDRETQGHTQRVTEMALQLAEIMGIQGLELVNIRRGGMLHDIGKLGVPDSILLKPGALTDDEWKVMRLHPKLAYEMLSPITFLRSALDIPYCHHEKWDGTGYPQGLKGEQIPLAARIFAVVDVWDAVTSNRPYRLAWSHEQVFNYLKEQSEKYFDPQVVNAFLGMISNDQKLT